jgi:hypothetical protein
MLHVRLSHTANSFIMTGTGYGDPIATDGKVSLVEEWRAALINRGQCEQLENW